MTNFIDWLAVHQIHDPGTVPVFGSEFRLTTNLQTGELLREQVIGFQHEGSWDTSLHIRSDGSTVAVAGNPSAFDRPDNLFGLDSVESGLNRIDDQLTRIGLPAFSAVLRPHGRIGGSVHLVPFKKGEAVMREGIVCRKGWYTEQGRQSALTQALLRDGRARLKRVDVTENIATNGAADFVRHLSSYVHHGKAGYLYPNGMTVEWCKGSRRIYLKYYVKAYDIGLRIKELRKKLRSREADGIDAHIAYLEKLKAWCEDHQIVRREATFKSTELIDRNLIYREQWSEDVMNNVIRPYQFHKKLNLEETRFTGIREQLERWGIPTRQARQAEMIHTSWVNGGDVKALCGSRPTFYRYRQILLGLGVDIANPCDISVLTVRAHRGEWQEIDPPSWYVLSDRVADLAALRAA